MCGHKHLGCVSLCGDFQSNIGQKDYWSNVLSPCLAKPSPFVCFEVHLILVCEKQALCSYSSSFCHLQYRKLGKGDLSIGTRFRPLSTLAHTHIHPHTHTHTHACARTHTHTHACTCTHTHAHTHTHACARAHIHTHTHEHTHTHTHTGKYSDRRPGLRARNRTIKESTRMGRSNQAQAAQRGETSDCWGGTHYSVGTATGA